MPPIVAPREDRRTFGIALLLLAQLLFTCLDTSAKWLAVIGMTANQIIFMRYFTHVLLILLLFVPLLRGGLFRSRNWRLEVLRGLSLLASTACNFISMRYLPLTVTSALLFTMPLMTCALSVPMLGERVGIHRWAAIAVGLVGILIIVRPGTEAFHPASLLSLSAALASALYGIFTRQLAGVDAAATQQIYAGAIALVAATPFAVPVWSWPADTAIWVVMLGLGVFGMVGHQLMTVAHRFASPSVLAPFSYLSLLYLAAASWLIFAQPPDASFYLGAPIIIASGLYIWLRERKAQREPVADAPLD